MYVIGGLVWNYDHTEVTNSFITDNSDVNTEHTDTHAVEVTRTFDNNE